MDRETDYETEVSLQEAIDRIHTLLHRAVRARKLSNIRKNLYKAQALLADVDDAVQCSTMYPRDEYCVVDTYDMEDK